MKCDIVIGGQWGDEGKAKMVDFLAQDYQVVARFQGGANAGHTVKHDGKKYVFHLLPSGVLHPKTTCVLGSGMVIDLNILLQEIAAVKEQGIDLSHRIKISSRAHLVLDYHILIDRLREEKKERIGTTGRGIGPAYSDKINRIGIRMSDLSDQDTLKDKLETALEEKRCLLTSFFGREVSECEQFDVEAIYQRLMSQYEIIKSMIVDSSYFLHEMGDVYNKSILLEGAQGTGLDIDFGSYPYVTSSSTSSFGGSLGSGIPGHKIGDIYGVFKAYITRVGGGRLPTALEEKEMEQLRNKGGEFGATTGRDRFCGWFDGVQARNAVMINGLTGIALTKLDILSGYPTIKFCTHYEIEGQKVDRFPDRLSDFEKVTPVYREFPGWEEDIMGMMDYATLPANARGYIEFLQDYLGCPIRFLSTGPERDQTIRLKNIKI